MTSVPRKSLDNASDAWHDRYRNQFYKTEMCRFMLNGGCNKGSACSHAHFKEELRAKPDLSKTRMCRSLLQNGACTNRKRCPYAHDIRQVRSTNAFFKTKVCSFYESGFCKLGSKCRYAHGQSELTPGVPSDADGEGVVINHSKVQPLLDRSGAPSSSVVSSASTAPSDIDHDHQVSARDTPTCGKRCHSEDLGSSHERELDVCDYNAFSYSRQSGWFPNYPGYHFLYQVNAPSLCTEALPNQAMYLPFPVTPLYANTDSDRTVITPVAAPYLMPYGTYGYVPVTQSGGYYSG